MKRSCVCTAVADERRQTSYFEGLKASDIILSRNASPFFQTESAHIVGTFKKPANLCKPVVL